MWRTNQGESVLFFILTITVTPHIGTFGSIRFVQ